MGERLLVRDAEHTALQYAHYLGATVPGLDALFAGAPPGADTLRELRAARALGDVFRFKLFDTQGRALLASDDIVGFKAIMKDAVRLHDIRAALTRKQVNELIQTGALQSGQGGWFPLFRR